MHHKLMSWPERSLSLSMKSLRQALVGARDLARVILASTLHGLHGGLSVRRKWDTWSPGPGYTVLATPYTKCSNQVAYRRASSAVAA
jgi:hypothetical protein